MEKSFRQMIHEWTLDTIKSNPEVFGGDNGNALIMKRYMDEHHQADKIGALHRYVYSVLSTVSRKRNLILKAQPELDHRKKHRPRERVCYECV